jgi:hypothetical protein
MKLKIFLFLVCAAVALEQTANAIPDGAYGFRNITGYNAANAAVGEAQVYMTVDPYGADVLFTFHNSGPAASSITDLYFDDGSLLGIATLIPSGSGVDFGLMADPWNLPGAAAYDLKPEYNGTPNRKFSAETSAPNIANGINPGESLGVVFKLQSGKSYSDVIASLTLSQTDIQHDIVGGLRVGVHVQGFEIAGKGESYINGPVYHSPPPPVPDASNTVTLLGLALLGLGSLHRRLARN